jgi:hypothetical protein
LAFRNDYAEDQQWIFRKQADEISSTTLAGSYRAELHPTGGGAGKDHAAHQLARVTTYIPDPARSVARAQGYGLAIASEPTIRPEPGRQPYIPVSEESMFLQVFTNS